MGRGLMLLTMAVANGTNRVEYVGNGSTFVPYVVTFRFDDPTWLRVSLVDVLGVVIDLPSNQWWVENSNLFTFSPVSAGWTVVIYRSTPATQSLVLPHSKDLERALDRQMMAFQDRFSGIRFPRTDSPSINTQLRSAVDRKGNFLRFNPATGGVEDITIAALCVLILANLGAIGSITDPNGLALALAAHLNDAANPHGVTKAQIGLGNAENTADLNKPISNAVAAALLLKLNASAVGSAAGYNIGVADGTIPLAQNTVLAINKAVAADIAAGTANKWLDAAQILSSFGKGRVLVTRTTDWTNTTTTGSSFLSVALGASKKYRLRAHLRVTSSLAANGAWFSTSLGGGSPLVFAGQWNTPGVIATAVNAVAAEHQPATSPSLLAFLVTLDLEIESASAANTLSLLGRLETSTTGTITVLAGSRLELEELS